MHYLNFSGERILPSIPALLDQPFWLDPSDPHHMAAGMQVASRPLAHDYTAASGNLGHDQIYTERVWGKAIHRVVTEGISPAQAALVTGWPGRSAESGACPLDPSPLCPLGLGRTSSCSAPFAPAALCELTGGHFRSEFAA
jgi:hypothetical protein